MGDFSRLASIAILGVVIVGGAFLVSSNDVAYGSQSLLASVLGIFNSSPSISISKNTNSPSGSVIVGRSQVLAVFDVKGSNLKGLSYITSVPVSVSSGFFSGGKLSVSNVSINYRYCLPKGNVYAYGYKYGYSGVYCSGMTVSPSSIVQKGNDVVISFGAVELPVYPNQVSALLTVSATPFAKLSAREPSRILARIVSPVSARGDTCKTIHYGIKKRGYGYTKCTATSLPVNLILAYGNWLTLSSSYGYPSNPPIIEPYFPNPQTAPATGGASETPTPSTNTTQTTPTTQTPPAVVTPPPNSDSPRTSPSTGGGKAIERSGSEIFELP